MYHFVEDKIKESIENGEFDDLPGKGKKLDVRDEFAGIPESMKQPLRILKRAGYLNEEQEKNASHLSERDLLLIATENQIEKKDADKRTAFQSFTKERNLDKSKTFKRYAQKIYQKFFGSNQNIS
ncbi:DUF1992 domain-containing protein [Oceanobacillus iheyensis]|uniref:Hypothetical conserved protein n=1 Tax=Oceanobacillus iheyensis (strain DSM 14371 / CIP 107618 / JCM 11309 / KCTC 3954 / HTE831) TaxID=221109 RepID=Q8ET64_OCEIH|nr:DUF1992 domain-containing protein [Oceanobacillus iheyensis]BAC12354.1 hypothetical conserved protein [Oceanobacillus iheyensis HTE831]